jgi:hypothetical protein
LLCTEIHFPKVRTFLESVGRNSVKTRKAYELGLKTLQRFLKQSYDSKENTESILDRVHRNEVNPYELIDGFVSYLVSLRQDHPDAPLAPTTVALRVYTVRSYFQYYDIDINPSIQVEGFSFILLLLLLVVVYKGISVLSLPSLLLFFPPSELYYLFIGIPIDTALRLIIIINAIIANEQMAPTKKIVVNAMSFGTVVVVVVPTSLVVVTSDVYRLINTPAITGPIAPPIILIVL